MTAAVAITGLGAVSGLGLGADALWQGLVSGQTALRARVEGDALGIGALPLSLVPLPTEAGELAEDLSAQVLCSPAPRATRMSVLAASEAWRDAGLGSFGAQGVPPANRRIGVCLGTTHGEKAPWLAALRRGSIAPPTDAHGPAIPAQVLAAAVGAGRVLVPVAACASGNVALAAALDWIRSGRCDVVLCGGCDALSDFVLRGFQSLRALSPGACKPFDVTRSGLSLGEGAAFLVLESPQHAQARGARVRAVLSGAGQSCDANHMTGPDREGRGAARAMCAALLDAGVTPAEIDFVSAHGTATIFNDQMEGRAIALVFADRAASVPVHSVKGALGHSMGAASALEAVVCVRALEEHRVPATIGLQDPDPAIPLRLVQGSALSLPLRHILSTASGFGGLNAAVVLSSAMRVPGNAAPGVTQKVQP
ncbi:MAG: beta-ketoacyl-[acyl-carrier-protein] synthase family protein [Myxococcales bacterium]|nr:beta-ketoacyl-[acyl-carrier-protein] synthase family protein [Myxococcales bacterium]